MKPALKISLLSSLLMCSTLGGGLTFLGSAERLHGVVGNCFAVRTNKQISGLVSRPCRSALLFFCTTSCPTYDAVREVMRVERLLGGVCLRFVDVFAGEKGD
jgi:hypothetical protein